MTEVFRITKNKYKVLLKVGTYREENPSRKGSPCRTESKMRKNEKVMRFRSGEQVGQRFLVVSNPLFCSFKFVNAQQTSASFSWPVFSFGHRALGTQRATDGDITWKYSRGTWAPFSYKALLGPAQPSLLNWAGRARQKRQM